MSVYQLSNDELLTLGTRILDNSQMPPIEEAMATVGYDEAAFQRGRALRDAFAASVQARQSEFGEQITATEALGDAWDAFHSQTYMRHVAIARIVFESDGVLRRLGVDGDRPDAFGAYLQEARRFYDTIAGDEALQDALAERGVDTAAVTQAQADLDQLEALDQTQEREKAEAQQATRARNDARRPFADWLADFQQFARVALMGQPDLVEQLGLTMRSE
ncbi:MAG: hypothetical protein GVY12_15885 [Bacteroidetes bacterium]|jgi:hypothetical protein|nr:hypothetical protein [Bacteroidota bacterium]